MARGIVLAVMAVLWLSPAAALAQQAVVKLSPEVQKRLGVATQRVALTHRASEIDAFAKVLDPGPLAQLCSDLATAEAAAEASRAEAARSKALNAAGGAVAAKDMEAAQSQARQDALKVVILRQRLGLEWGPGVARLSGAARDRLVNALSRGAAALVHVDTANNAGQAGARTVKIDVGDGSVVGQVLGPARQAEPRLQSSGLIVEVTGSQAILLSIGLTQSAHIETTSQETGAILPRGAILRYRGSDWAYVRTGPDTFERRLAATPEPGADGFFVAQGFAAGDEVVTSGAAALFAAEQNQAVKGD